MDPTAHISNLQEQVARLEALVLMLGQAQGIGPEELKRRADVYMGEGGEWLFSINEPAKATYHDWFTE